MTADQFIDFFARYYFVIVVSMFVFFLVAEMVIPLTRTHENIGLRWFSNLTLLFSVVLVFRLGGPVLALVTAFVAEYFDFGLFNYLDLSLVPALIVGIVLLDLKQYLFHFLMHFFDILWRVHRVHHSDVEVDLTTGFRFHPFEAILSALMGIVVVLVFGISVEAIVLLQVLNYFANFFNHCNILLPPRVDRYLKSILVTPSMHHLHHALDQRAANRNFGVLFSFWDRLFGTYIDRHPDAGAAGAAYRYGLQDFQEGGGLNPWVLMCMPFKRASGVAEESTAE